MELNPSEASQILKSNRVEVSAEDPRSVISIAEQFMLTGEVALKGAQDNTEVSIMPSEQ